MMKRPVSLVLCAALLLSVLSLGGCSAAPAAREGSAAPKASPVPAQPLSDEAQLAPAETPAPLGTQDPGEAAADFAVRLLRASGEENALLSPLSILCALGMTMGGAKGETLAQFERSLGISRDDLNEYLGTLSASLAEEDGLLHLADGIWIRDDPDLVIEPDFLDLARNVYGAAVEKTAFDEAALGRINGFVKEHTRGMIEKVLDGIPRDAVMYLVNALAFDARWETPYAEDGIRTGDFLSGDGARQTGEFLFSRENMYLQDEGCTGFLKYYEGHRYAFAALLPEEGTTLDSFISGLDGKRLRRLLAEAAHTKVDTKTPKLELEYAAQLQGVLADMGITDAFDENLADFSSMGHCKSGDNLFISRVLHKTYLKLDEAGTKAGAVTAVEMMKTTAVMEPRPIPKVYLDRPFVYLILDCETNLPVFLGRVDRLP